MSQKRNARRQALLAKTNAEIDGLVGRGCRMAGNAFSAVLFLKGAPSQEERFGAEPLSGEDGKALRASLQALGYAPQEWAALLTVSEQGKLMPAELLREAVAVLDPSTLVCCDDEAAACVREAYAAELAILDDFMNAMLEPGRVVQLAGMRMLNLGGFEAALGSTREKQRMWARLKQIAPLGEPY